MPSVAEIPVSPLRIGRRARAGRHAIAAGLAAAPAPGDKPMPKRKGEGPMQERTDIVTVTVACSDGDQARKIAAGLVEGRLAACAQILPVESVYRWRGKLERDREHLVVVKTLAACLPALERLVTRAHSYEVPEILALPVAWAHAPYAEWLRESVEVPGG
jgi:periplasmic divalent cation tolerance protein